MEESIIKVYENDGSIVNYNILFTFECEELKKSYIAFTKDDVLERVMERLCDVKKKEMDKCKDTREFCEKFVTIVCFTHNIVQI